MGELGRATQLEERRDIKYAPVEQLALGTSEAKE